MSEKWEVTAESANGDDYGLIGSFDHQPTVNELRDISHYKVVGCDGWGNPVCDPGPGDFGGYLYLTVERVS